MTATLWHLTEELEKNLDIHFPASNQEKCMRQGLCLVEEAGEYAGARRLYEHQRGPLQDVADELADVVITGHLAARYLSIHLNTVMGETSTNGLLCVLENACVFAGSLRRYLGAARRTGTRHEVATDLAKLVLAAHFAARDLGIDLDAAIDCKARKILTRGWKDRREECGNCGYDYGGRAPVWPCPRCQLAPRCEGDPLIEGINF